MCYNCQNCIVEAMKMDVHVLTKMQTNLSFERACLKLRVNEDYREEFQDIYNQCMEIASPKCMFGMAEVSVEGSRTCVAGEWFDSRLMRENMGALGRAFPSIATCGRELYERYQQCDDILEKFWVDGISELLLNAAASQMRARIQETYHTERLSSMSPGSLNDFPIVHQQALFRMFGNPFAAIGVELTPENLMLPHKSCSAIYFESKQPYENCAYCPRPNCPNRRARFVRLVGQ